jgi:F420H(2)-dependent quinone reductase
MSGLFPRILRTHQWIYEHTGGLLGHRLLFGNPTLHHRPAHRAATHRRPDLRP